MTDLADRHGFVSDLFPNLEHSNWKQYRLTDQQVQFFHTHGYLCGIKLLNENQIQALREELDEFFHPNHRGHELWHEYHSNESSDKTKTLFHALGAWRLRAGFHDLLWNPAMLVPASQLLEGDVRFWHDQLFCKPANHGGSVAWHQDYSYWTRTRPMAHLTCWTGLDDTTVANGCLQYIPGSHQWPLLPSTGLAGDMNAIRNVLSDQQWDKFQNPVSIELKAGYATFHHPLLIHGSSTNSTNTPRRATVINVIRDGVQSYSDSPLLSNVPPIKKGEKLQGKFFPLLYQK